LPENETEILGSRKKWGFYYKKTLKTPKNSI